MDGDFVKGHYNQKSIYATHVDATVTGERPHLQRALREGDYSFETIKKVLEETKMKAQKNTKGKVLGSSDREVLYETVGLYTHGGVFGVTTRTKSDEDLVRYVNQAGVHHQPDGATWSSVTLAKGCKADVHHDYNNLRESKNYVFTVGGRDPGNIWIETKDIDESTAGEDRVKWKDVTGRGWTPGTIQSSLHKVVNFDPFLKHATHNWDDDKWCLIYHSTKSVKEVSPELRKYLKNLGFRYPCATTTTRRSSRKVIFSNAVKISVMMASLLAATDSCLGRGVFADKAPEPIVMFEIGGYTGTEEAVKLDKDVFEPMTWETYSTSEGREAAFHIVNGGYPRSRATSEP